VTRPRIVLIGATGAFGQRLARLLAKLNGIELIVTSRSQTKAEARAAELQRQNPGVHIYGASLDTGRGVEAQMIGLSPFLVIDASGPFQAAGYETARAALTSGAHWIDIADASGFILGFQPALDALARSEALCAFTGASTSPALSGTVVSDLTQGWQRVDSIDIAIRPGGATRMGRSVIDAVLSYAGRPIATWQDGGPLTVTGWGWPVRCSMPGIGRVYLSSVETADAALMSKRFGVTSRVRFRFGLQSRIEHFGLVLLGLLRRAGWIAKPERLAPLLERAHGVLSCFGSGTGGMTVDVSGLDRQGRATTARWWMIARQGHGPNVPVLAAMALTRKLLAGARAPGARPADEALAIEDIEAEMRAFDIATERSTEVCERDGLFERALGPAQYGSLAPMVQAFHNPDALPLWHGRADVTAGASPIARLLAFIFGFPPTAADVPVMVSVERDQTGETWTRNFAGATFSSRLSVSKGELSERFGPFHIRLGLEARGGEIQMPIAGWRLGPLPLPGFLAPRSDTREFQDQDGRFRFDVRISAPGLGLIAHYRGWLTPAGLKPATIEGKTGLCPKAA
jgi:saccharopine dehydrogenase-like NADP-dependent oxidoreductase